MVDFSSITAVIPVRAGSQRIPGKNLREFHKDVSSGTVDSLLTWKINQLSEVISPSNILVSSDWDEALDEASKLGCVALKRPKWLCMSDSPFDEVIYELATHVDTHSMLWCPVTSPFVGPSVIRDFLNIYLSSEGVHQKHGLLLTSEIKDYFFLSGKPLNFPLGRGHVQTQEIIPLTRWSWALSVRSTAEVLSSKYMFSEKARFFDASPLTTFDINEEVEYLMAQSMVSLYLSQERKSFDV